MAGKYNTVAEQGATYNLNFTVATDGVAWDLTSYSAQMQVRRSANDANTLLDLSDTAGDITMNSSGEVAVTVSASDTNTLPVGRWFYDFELTSAGNEVTRLLEGRFIVSGQVTQ